jgi:hypothetical protein
MLEQEPWDPYTGHLTAAAAVAYLDALLYGDPDAELSEMCGTDKYGTMYGAIYVYPSPQTLNYRLAVTNGSLGMMRLENLTHREVLQVNMATDPPLRYPASLIFSATWLSGAWAVDGTELPAPAVDISGSRPHLAFPVVGSLLVVYKVVRHQYEVIIPPRTEATENIYQSHVYAVWNGGTRVMEFTTPPGISKTDSAVRCNNSLNTWMYGIDPLTGLKLGDSDFIDHPDDPPTVKPEDESKYWDYCANAPLEGQS